MHYSKMHDRITPERHPPSLEIDRKVHEIPSRNQFTLDSRGFYQRLTRQLVAHQHQSLYHRVEANEERHSFFLNQQRKWQETNRQRKISED